MTKRKSRHIFPVLENLGIDREIYRNIIINKFESDYPEKEFKQLFLKVYNPLSTESKNVDLSRKELANLNLDVVVLSCLIGTIFSDSSLVKNGKNFRLGLRHSTRETEWFLWKTIYIFKDWIKCHSENIVYSNSLWKEGNEFCNSLSGYLTSIVDSNGLAIDQKIISSVNLTKPDGFQSKCLIKEKEFLLGNWHVQTLNNPTLTHLHKILYNNNKKVIKRAWLNHMNNFFLMTIWLDDGSLSGHRQGSICWYDTPKDQAKIFIDYLKTVWDIECYIKVAKDRATATNASPVEIHIRDIENLEKLCSIIAPIIPVKSMLYKVCLYHTSSSNRQRWTCNLKSLIRQDWHEEIDRIYNKLEEDIVHL